MNSKQEELTGKVQQWFKENVSIIAIVIISVVYVLYGLIHITETGKTIGEIVADGAVSFLMGFLIKMLLNNQGISNGEKSHIFINTKNFYTGLLDEISSYQHYLGAFCDWQNEETLKKAQTMILKSELLKYDDFIEGKIIYKNLSKSQKKAFKKAKKIKINLISEANLLSDCQNFIETGNEVNVNKNSYVRKNNSKTILIMIFTALLFGYFSVDNSEFNVHGMIWSLIQIAYYLGFGAVQYFQGYTFMTDTYKTALVRKSNYIEKFKNMYKENPNRFKNLEEENKEKKVEVVDLKEMFNEQ